MVNQFRNVMRSDGSMHLEQQMGTMRFDLSNGGMTQILSSVGNIQTVVRPDGSCGTEQTFGNLRFNLDRGEFDQLF